MKKIILCLIAVLCINGAEAQSRLAYLSYVFPGDSLSGFNEASAKQEALNRGFFGSEFKVFMYRAKRNYINEKYGYNNGYVFKQEAASIAGAPCVNEDFEASPIGPISSVAGWTITEGQNTSSCTMGGCCSTVATGVNSWIRATPYVAPMPVGTIPNSPLGGTKVIQLNDNVISAGEVVRLTQTFPVTTSNSLLQYAYLCALNGTGHVCCDNPFFNVLLYDCTNNLISSGSYTLLPPGSACSTPSVSNWIANTSGISYHTGWQVKSVDLSPYIGSCVKMEVTVGDCTGWAHEGYCFFDAKCSAFSVSVNGVYHIPSGIINTCGSPATLTVPSGTTSVLWSGPTGSGITSNTNTSITTSVSGTYTLSMGTGTTAIANVFTLNINPIPTISLTATSSTACTSGNTVALTGSPSGGVYSGVGVTGGVFTPPAAPGNYSVTYMYTSPTTSCTNTKTLNISVSVCTGVEALSGSSIEVKIYPNPNTGDFMIEGRAEEVVSVTNELGQVIKTLKLNSANNYSASVTNLASGVYFVNGRNFKEKIVVTK